MSTVREASDLTLPASPERRWSADTAVVFVVAGWMVSAPTPMTRTMSTIEGMRVSDRRIREMP